MKVVKTQLPAPPPPPATYLIEASAEELNLLKTCCRTTLDALTREERYYVGNLSRQFSLVESILRSLCEK